MENLVVLHRSWRPIATDPISRRRRHRSPVPSRAPKSSWTVLLRPITAAPPLPANNSNIISSARPRPIEALRHPTIWPHGPSIASRFDSTLLFFLEDEKKEKRRMICRLRIGGTGKWRRIDGRAQKEEARLRSRVVLFFPPSFPLTDNVILPPTLQQKSR